MARMYRNGISLFGALLINMTITPTATGAPVQPVWQNGPPSNRLDIAILGDGYTAAERDKFADDVEAVLASMFDQEPFRTYRAYFNVSRVDVVSAESGADHPASGVFRDTALGSFYDCAEITRLICVDHGRVNDVLLASLEPDRRDIVLVLVNDVEYGGSGGSIAVASLDPSVVELVLHELGHTLGLLADEYRYSPPECWVGSEPAAANVTIETERSRIKWAPWIRPETAIPTYTAADDVPGLYEGAEYCDSGKYRATYDSKMGALFRPFESINVEQLTKRIYAFVSPIDRAGRWPTRGSSPLRRFYVRTLAPMSPTLRVRWELNGEFLSSERDLRINLARLRAGTHQLRLTVWDATLTVRQDSEQVLTDTRTWQLTGRNR